MKRYILLLMLFQALLWACNKDNSASSGASTDEDSDGIELSQVAEMLSAIPFQLAQVQEVYDAVVASSDNGYDEEYTMQNLFTSPGAGVGDDESETKAGSSYDTPFRDLIEEYVSSLASTKSSDLDADEYIDLLSSSDVQIYWPYSDNWDGASLPIITYAPTSDDDTLNVGYVLTEGEDGSRIITEEIIGESTAMERPVWVVNRNDDASYTSLELLRRSDPNWGSGGGSISVSSSGTKSSDVDDTTVRSLYLRDFLATRNYDNWFCGASEFFVKCGSVEDFTASTEDEMREYSPTITDFMVVVKRSQIGTTIPFDAVLVSEWTDQLESVAFLINEDDGGEKTTWSASAVVKLNSKSWGVEVSIPINRRDDIVWRGSLGCSYLEKISGQTGNFGDVKLTFELVEW